MDNKSKFALYALICAVLSALMIGIGTNLYIGAGIFFAFASATYILDLYMDN